MRVSAQCPGALGSNCPFLENPGAGLRLYASDAELEVQDLMVQCDRGHCQV